MVVLAYVFFGSYGRFAFHTKTWDTGSDRPGDGYYTHLIEGFRRGRISMIDKPDPLLMALPDPYDYEARHNVPYMWDASYLNGHYYLYFSPLPALILYWPTWIATGRYPSDQFASVFFATWAAIMAGLFVRRAIGAKRQVPLFIWIVMLGLAGVVPFIMAYSRTYEVATICGMAMTATWAWSLLRYMETRKTSALVWMSIWLSLSIIARPNLGVLLLPAFLALPKPRLRPAIIALIPLSIFGLATISYNYARFHNPFEFGHRYQLTYMSMANYKVCGCRNKGEALRLVHSSMLYVLQPPSVTSEFPYFGLPRVPLDHAVSFSDLSEEVGGLVPLIPIAAIGSVLAALAFLRRRQLDTGSRAALIVIAAGWLSLLGLSGCWFVTARYEVDFLLLIAAGSVVLVDRAADTRAIRALAILLAIYSILVGVLLGLKGTNDTFPRENPKLFEKLKRHF